MGRWGVRRMTTGEAAVKLGVTERGVRGLIREGVLPARRQGRGWDVEEADLKALAYDKGRHRQPRERWPSRTVQPVVDDGTYLVREAVIAHEMVRICRQLHKQATAQYDYDPEAHAYRLVCTAHPSRQWWGGCEKAAIRFVHEMNRRELARRARRTRLDT